MLTIQYSARPSSDGSEKTTIPTTGAGGHDRTAKHGRGRAERKSQSGTTVPVSGRRRARDVWAMAVSAVLVDAGSRLLSFSFAEYYYPPCISTGVD